MIFPPMSILIRLMKSSVALPNLTYVQNFYLASSDDDFNCQSFEYRRCRGIITDQFQCQGKTVPIGKTPSSCDNPHRGSSLSLRKKLVIAFGVVLGVLLMIASIFLYWFRGSRYSLLRRLRRGDNMKIDDKISKHRRIDSNNSDIWFESSLDADTRYMYVNRNRVMHRGRPVSGR